MVKPKVNSEGQKELDKIADDFEKHDERVRSLTLDNLKKAPKREEEQQTLMSQSDIAKTKDIYLKPIRSISSQERFNEDYREDYEFSKEYVYIIAENKELIGDTIHCWTKPFPGMSAEEWKVPTNKPIYVPRYLAEQIKRKNYTKLVMKEHIATGSHQYGTMYGSMVADETIQRLDAHPVSTRKSIFMSA